ncbi:type II secretion system protein [Planctomycetota bacterium]
MSRNLHNRKSLRGFTLIELLVVVSIIAVLAGILLPAIAAVSRAAKVAGAQSLISRIEIAANQYQKDQTHFPPDCISLGTYKYLNPFDGSPHTPGIALPPEAVYYYLSNPFVAAKPYIQFAQGAEATDYNRNDLPEVLDPWGRPILYNRGRFPGKAYNVFNYAGPTQSSTDYEAADGKPWHKRESFDIYSLGPDGTTGGRDGTSGKEEPPDCGLEIPNLATYVDRAMLPAGGAGGGCGNEADDVCNWK